MGKLLLAHIQSATLAPSSEQALPIKNTFIHFRRKQPLKRTSTDPAGGAAYDDNLESTLRRTYAPSSTMQNDGYELTPTLDEECPITSTVVSKACTDAHEPTESDQANGFGKDKEKEDTKSGDDTARGATECDEEAKCFGKDKEKEDTKSGDDTARGATERDEECTEMNSIWQVDGRKFTGRDTRVSTVLRPFVHGGPDYLDIVASIFPTPASTKRGGSCFKASEGRGRLQLKCNKPVDQDLAVIITVGSGKCKTTHCQKNNFMSNPLMTFDGDWNFKALVDTNTERPAVTLTLHLSKVGDGAVPDGKIGLMLSPPPRAPSPQQTPLPSPRSITQSTWTTPVCSQSPTVKAAPSSPFFSVGNSVLFTFSLRRADEVELGLEVMRDEENQELLVQKVVAGGAVESWNRQCFAGPCANKALVPEDRIVRVNGRMDCAGMLEECRERHLLKIFVVRGSLPHSEIPLGWCGANPFYQEQHPAPCWQAPVQLVAVPIVFPVAVPCAKHGIVHCDEGVVAPPNMPDPNLVPTSYEAATSSLRAAAPEFCPSVPGQDGNVQ